MANLDGRSAALICPREGALPSEDYTGPLTETRGGLRHTEAGARSRVVTDIAGSQELSERSGLRSDQPAAFIVPRDIIQSERRDVSPGSLPSDWQCQSELVFAARLDRSLR